MNAPDSTREAPWAVGPEEVVLGLDVEVARGLSASEAARRLREHGPNLLRQGRRRSVWRILWDQFANLIVALLVAAAVVSFCFDEVVEGFAILAVLVLNSAIGFTTERRALRSMEALRDLGRHETTVRRDGVVRSVPAGDLVPGDVVILDAGDVLTADLRLLSASRFQVDESSLTGESLPVNKRVEAVPADTPLIERTPMLYKGTAVTRGSGEGVVVATGMSTELGLISSLVEQAEPEATPLEKRLDRLAHRLLGLTLAIAALVAVGAVISGRELVFALEISIALAVATIPEGLPIVATVALARGMWRMARRNALVEQLSAVQTLGSTTVILTDKTGTLTENRMTVVELRLHEGAVQVAGHGAPAFRDEDGALDATVDGPLQELLRVAVLCNNAARTPDPDGAMHATGDPTEVALLVLGARGGYERAALIEEWPEVREFAFDPATQRMATVHGTEDRWLAAVKGAPEAVLGDCTQVRTRDGTAPLDDEGRSAWLQRAHEMAATGRRVLTLARSTPRSADSSPFEGLTLLGLAGFEDPPRRTVRAAIEACQAAGIRVTMVTGDHGATAWSVAAEVGLIDPAPGAAMEFVDGRALRELAGLPDDERARLRAAAVIARATPQQKLDLIELHQQAGEVVAMTGDGVNDAPALKKADIGIAMGLRGTQVAREAADMVLRDDEFGTIVTAVAQGRAILANIRKFVIYLLSCNVSEILVVGVGAVIPGPLPLLPLQILFLNLVTDVLPALALGVCEGGAGLMDRPPRDPREPLVTRRHWRGVFGLGGVMAACVLAALLLATRWLKLSADQCTTVTFLALALAQLWHVFSMRDRGSGWARNEVTRNVWVWGALAVCALLLLAAVYWRPLAQVLAVADPGGAGWGVALGCSLGPLLVGQTKLALDARRARAPTAARP